MFFEPAPSKLIILLLTRLSVQLKFKGAFNKKGKSKDNPIRDK